MLITNVCYDGNDLDNNDGSSFQNIRMCKILFSNFTEV